MQPDEEREANHPEAVASEGRVDMMNGADAARRGEDAEDVEEIGPDGIAYRHIDIATACGDDAGKEFGQAGADGNDGEADDTTAHAQTGSNGGGTLHQPFGTPLQGSDGNEETESSTVDGTLTCVPGK